MPVTSELIDAGASIPDTVAADWAPGGKVSLRIPVILRRFESRGITPTTTSWTFAISWWQGETDNVNGTSAASYESSIASIMTAAQNAGLLCTSCRFFVNEQTWAAGATSATIQGAQATVVTNDPTHFFTGGNIDSLNASNRIADNRHLNDTGAAAAATLVYNAMHASGAPF